METVAKKMVNQDLSYRSAILGNMASSDSTGLCWTTLSSHIPLYSSAVKLNQGCSYHEGTMIKKELRNAKYATI